MSDFFTFVSENFWLFLLLGGGVFMLQDEYPLIYAILGAKSISPQQAKTKAKEGFIMVDTRDSKSFDKENIEGSINIELATLVSEKNNITENVIICGATNMITTIATLKKHGCKNIHILLGGINSWKQSGLKINAT